MMLVILSTYANVWFDLPWSRTNNQGLGQTHNVFVDYVSQGLMCVLFFCYCLNQWLIDRRSFKALVWLGLALLSLGAVLFLLQGRSGLVALVVASATLICYYAPRRQLLFLVFIFSGVIAVFVMQSPLMWQQLLAGYTEVSRYQPNSLTSLGTRIDLWRFAFDQTLMHPFLGAGLGSYPEIAAKHFGHCTYVCTHPHNQYLFFSFEMGVVGLGAFAWLLWRSFESTLGGARHAGALLASWVAVLAVDSLYNAPFWYRAQSYFAYAMLALLLASVYAGRPVTTSSASNDHL